MAKQENLAIMSIDELVELRAQIQDAIERKVEAERKELQVRLDARSGYRAEAGVRRGNDGSRRRPRGRTARAVAHPLAGKKVPVKYRGPNGETWSGRGLTPRGLTELEAKGKKRESYFAE